MIALDIDGVIANLYPEIIYRAKQEGFDVDPELAETHNCLWEDISPDITADWVHSHFDDPTFWLNAKPFEDAWYWINQHTNKGIVCVTHRPDTQDCRAATWRWFTEWDILVDDIYHVDDKAKKIAELGSSLFVEDTMHIAFRVSSVLEIPTYIVDRAYNRSHVANNVIRVNTLHDIKP